MLSHKSVACDRRFCGYSALTGVVVYVNPNISPFTSAWRPRSSPTRKRGDPRSDERG